MMNKEQLFNSKQLAAAVAEATKPLEKRICDLTACKWPDAYTVIPVEINGQLHATSQAISNEINSIRSHLAAAQEEVSKWKEASRVKHLEAVDWAGKHQEVTEQLAAATLNNKQLREAIQDAVDKLRNTDNWLWEDLVQALSTIK